jgi:hypothetical protein
MTKRNPPEHASRPASGKTFRPAPAQAPEDAIRAEEPVREPVG